MQLLLFLLLLSLLQVNETLAGASTSGLNPVDRNTYNIREEEPSDSFQHYSSRFRGNGSALLTGEMDFQMPNFATEVCLHKEIVNASLYGDIDCSSGSFRLSEKVGYHMTRGGTPEEKPKIHSHIHVADRAREKGVRRRKKQHRQRERESGHSRSEHKHRIERNFLCQHSLLHYLVLGMSFTGLLFLWVLLLRDNEHPQSLPSQQIDVSLPASSPACGYYSYGVTVSALALVLFLIHFCIKKFGLRLS